MGTLHYRSNNSGGDWWLSDEDWKALEEAGWTVDWKDVRWLGALATSASVETDNAQGTISEWETITGQSASDEGCNCCGEPHGFSYEVDGQTMYLRNTYAAVDSYWV